MCSFSERQPTQSFGNEDQLLLGHVEQTRSQQILHCYCSHGVDTCGGRAVKETFGDTISSFFKIYYVTVTATWKGRMRVCVFSCFFLFF